MTKRLHRVESRYSAAAVHFLLSLAIFSALIAILLRFWYPTPFFSASGGWQGLRIVALVDLVLGPLLTLVIFNPAKSRKELRMDLAFVVLIQLGALLWGIRAVHEQRPVAVVFLDSSFYTVPAAALTAQGIDLAVLEQFGDERPVYVYVERPTEGEAYERFARAVNEENVPPHEQAWLYRPATDHFATIVRASLDIREIMAANEDMKRDIEQLLASTETEIDDNYYITLTSRYRNIILVFDREGHLTGTINAPYHTGDV